MKLFPIVFVTYCAALASAEESKFQEIIELLNNNERQLKAEAQTYSAAVSDPSGYNSGFSRNNERSRFISSSQPSNADDEKKLLDEEEEEKKPDRLAILLADSKFSCESLKNGYYADESVGCQVFHYCIDGVKHSWQCPENTVFHQIHLNCVPNTQDICQQSSKYHIVNEYLHKELDERGPNNTVLYHQRFYPDGFDYSGGDPVIQIFQAQAQAQLQKAQQAQRQPRPAIEIVEEEEELSRPRSRVRAQYVGQNSPQTHQTRPQVNQNANKPVYRQSVNRQLVNYPAQQSKPTTRPLSYTSSSENFAPPTYTESPQDEFSSAEFSSADTGSSGSTGFQASAQLSPTSHFTVAGPSSSGSASPSFTGTATASFSPSSATQSGNIRITSGSSRSGYPTRSLGIPIASFRVAPSSSFTASSSVPTAQASSIREVRTGPIMSVTSLNNLHNENRQILSHLFY